VVFVMLRNKKKFNIHKQRPAQVRAHMLSLLFAAIQIMFLLVFVAVAQQAITGMQQCEAVEDTLDGGVGDWDERTAGKQAQPPHPLPATTLHPLYDKDISGDVLRKMTGHPMAPVALRQFRCTPEACVSDARITAMFKMFDVAEKDLAHRLCPMTCGTRGNEANTTMPGTGTDKLCGAITGNKGKLDDVYRLCRYEAGSTT
jgi:hypothetical protein